jgi:hypothetical protein
MSLLRTGCLIWLAPQLSNFSYVPRKALGWHAGGVGFRHYRNLIDAESIAHHPLLDALVLVQQIALGEMSTSAGSSAPRGALGDCDSDTRFQYR